MTVLVPFARSGSERHPLARFAADSGARWLQRDLNDTDGTSTTAGPPEGSPWTKIAGRELSQHLERVPAHATRRQPATG